MFCNLGTIRPVWGIGGQRPIYDRYLDIQREPRDVSSDSWNAVLRSIRWFQENTGEICSWNYPV